MADSVALIARMEVRIRDAERQLAKIGKQAEATVNGMERRFSKINPQVAPGFGAPIIASFGAIAASAGVAVAAIAGRELVQAMDTWTELGNRLRNAGVGADELAAQQQKVVDIALASRQPLAQVGELYAKMLQTTQVLGVESGQAAIATQAISQALAAAGVSAATAQGALVQLGQALQSGVLRGDEFNSVMEGLGQSSPIIQSIAREFGVTTQQLRSLAEEGQLVADRVFKAIIDAGPQIEASFANSIPTVSQAFTNLQTAVTNFAGALDSALGVSNNLSKGLGVLTGALNTAANALREWNAASAEAAAQNALAPPTQYSADELSKMSRAGIPLGGDLNELNRQIAFARRAREATIQAIKARKEWGDISGSDSAASRRAPYGGPQPPVRPKSELGDMDGYLGDLPSGGGGGKKGGGGGGGKAATDELKRATDQLKERTLALQLDTQALGMNTFESEKLKAETALLNEATANGKTVTEEQRASITQLAEAWAQAKVDFEAAQQAQERLQEVMEGLRNVAGAGLSTLVSDLREGKSAAEALENALDRMLDVILQIVEQSILNALFPSGGGGGGLGGLLAGLIPRAAGGPFSEGKPHLVGENGPELMIPNASGTVIPNSMLNRLGGGGAVQVVINNNGDNQVSTKQSQNGDGQRIDVSIDKMNADKISTPGSYTDRSLQRRFGVRPGLTRR